MENKFLRWANAVIAALVCTAIGMSGAHYAYSQPANCSLKDVAEWKQRLVEPTQEATPFYRLGVSEDFIRDCPNRPEVGEAHREAGKAALDGDLAEEAKRHLDRALAAHSSLQPREWFGLMAALIETGDEARAWKERDALVEHWVTGLENDGLADVVPAQVDGGTIYAVQFIALEPGSYVRGVWLGVPEGPGWPSAIVLGSDELRSVWSQLRTRGSQRIEHIDLIGCKDRITLTQTEGEIAFSTAKSAATAALETYLEQPELPRDNGATDLSSQCLWPHHMMPRPDPYEAVLID